MEKKKATIANPVTIAGVTLIPVYQATINCWYSKQGIALSGGNHPVSIIIVTSSEKRAYRITGEEITFAQLAQEVPDIMETLREI